MAVHPVERFRILYISYDGVMEPLGASQVLAYIERLASEFALTVLSFEKSCDINDSARLDSLRRRLEAQGVGWRALAYHKRPAVLSTAWDIAQGLRAAVEIAKAAPPHIVHARSYVPGVMALEVCRRTGAKFLFDMRGFWVDEKVEAGSWRKGSVVYRVGKWFERRFLARADAIVSLTHEGVRVLPQLGLRPERGIPIDVIPTCVDVRRFEPGRKDPSRLAALGLSGRHVVGSVGTLSNRYLRDDTLRYLTYLTRVIDGLKVLLVTREDHAQLRRAALAAGLDPNRLVLTAADFADMPALVRLLDVAVFFMKPVFAQKGSVATKMAEFLACGIPVIVNDGVADSSAIVRSERVGVVMPDMSSASFDACLPAVRTLFGDPEVKARCRDVALRLFDADRGADRYGALYRAVVSRQS